jgi:nucleoside-diphosphate-sugar epimerase
MTHLNSLPQLQSAFVTGATGLLGNNLVRLLLSRGRAREGAEPLANKGRKAIWRSPHRDCDR